MNDIYDGNPESEAEDMFWARLEKVTENIRLIEEIAEVMGIDMVPIMRSMLKSHYDKNQ